MIDFQGSSISSDTGFILLREVDERFSIIDPMQDCLEDPRSPANTKHALVQMVRQRVCQVAAGYEDCNDADFLRIDPALRLEPSKNLRTKGVVSSKSKKKIRLEENLCYLGLKRTVGPQKEGLLRDILPGWEVPQPILSCGGQSCRIISDTSVRMFTGGEKC
jgi:hypothetical protein